jgi:UDP-glucose 6-dehydrogenase
MSRVMKLAGKDLESPEKRREYTACIVGCGRTGMISACLFAEAGFKVICVDSSSHTVHLLKRRKSPFTESYLRKFIEPRIKESPVYATTNIRKAVSESDIIMISVSASIDNDRNLGKRNS